jgi:sigma-B regulation protein RsbU (phosphoserine phosphatase)
VDVSGHGVGAAMMSLAVARQFLHGRAVERFLFSADNQPASPAEVVQILNGRFCSDEAEIVSYFTLIYGVIDLTTGEGNCVRPGIPRRLSSPWMEVCARSAAVGRRWG